MDTNEMRGPEESARRSRLNSGIVAAGVAFGLTLAGLGVAAAQTGSSSDTSTTTAAAQADDSTSSTTAQSSDSGSATTPSTEGSTAAPATPAAPSAPGAADPGTGRPARPDRPEETPLTGDVAEKVKAAALAAVPDGTIIRVETDSDGSPYEAHVRKADGTEVVVKVDESFKVTATEEGGFGGHHGPGGPGGRGPGGPGPGETPLTGDTAAKVTAAAQAAVPGGTVLRVETDSDGSPYEAHVRKADGTEVEVKVDASFNVTSVEEHAGPR